MKNLLIKGGAKLSGSVSIKGSKNAALPIMCAALLVKGRVVLTNVPDISDVKTLCKIFDSINVHTEFKDNTLIIDSTNISLAKFDKDLFCKMRASVLVIPALLKHFGKGEIGIPGGCVLGKRSLQTHYDVLSAFNCQSEELESSIKFSTDGFISYTGIIPEASVTASENAIMLAVSSQGKSVIQNLACEPHVEDLCKFLISLGADIKGVGTSKLEINGGLELKQTQESHSICGDYLQAGTYILMAAITNSPIEVKNFNPEDLGMFLYLLKKAGVKFAKTNNSITVTSAENLKPVDVKTAVHPGFPTDLLSPFVIFLTQCNGKSTIFETLFEGRFSFLYELEKMGAEINILNNHQAEINGPTKLKGKVVNSCDIRAGAAMVLAAMIASDQTIITDIKYIDRGYDNFDKNIKDLGGIISRQII